MKYPLLLFFALLFHCSQSQYLIVTNEWLLGQVDYAKDVRFKTIPKKYASKENLKLYNTALDSLIKMIGQAKKEGIELKVISAVRSFGDQRRIWNTKYDERKAKFKNDVDIAKDILQYSSMPGTSRHHWGTDIDLNSLSPEYFTKGKGKKEYEWLCLNAERFGFYQPYTADKNRTGYQSEPWHWSFYPISQQLLQVYNQNINYSNLVGFKGSSSAITLEVIKNYVNGIAIAP